MWKTAIVSVLATAFLTGVSLAQAPTSAPGQAKPAGTSAKKLAPGQKKAPGTSAKTLAPPKAKQRAGASFQRP